MSPPDLRCIPLRISQIVAVCLLAVTGLEAMGQAGVETVPPVLRTQTIRLEAGWNAVFLEVEPLNPDPEVVFAGLPLEAVASFQPRGTGAQFVSNPGANLFRRAGWSVWYAEDRPDAFLKTLHSVPGRQGYLIQSREAFTWNLTGQVVSEEVRWQANAFNLVGFSVVETGAPTFAQFFAGSKAHRHNRLYRLERGNWRRVTAPDSELMRSGEAFWIFCEGGSTYQGPLSVRTLLGRQILLGTGTEDLTLKNATSHPLTPSVEHIPVGTDPVPLSVIIKAVGGNTMVQSVAAPKPAAAWVQPLPPLEGGAAIRLPLEARTEAMNRAYHVSLIKITTDLGTVNWLPVAAHRKDLEEQ